MTQQQINDGIAIFEQYARGAAAGRTIATANQFIDKLVNQLNWQFPVARDFTNILIQSGLVNFTQQWLKLTDHGYATICGDLPYRLTPNLRVFFDHSHKRESIFNRIWTIIGGDKGSNPFYIDGPVLYQHIHQYIPTLPADYADFLADRTNRGESPARTIWAKHLFMALTDTDAIALLDSLTQTIADRQNQPAETPEQTDREAMQTTDTTKKPKIFISHNHADAEYARELVDLLHSLGVAYGDIFCSSYDGCGVPFGTSFLDSIRGQYDGYDLLVLYIHSPRYYRSPVSLCEMGAAWILRTAHRSFLTADCDYGMLKGVVTSEEIAFHPTASDAAHRLNEFRELIERTFALRPIPASAWERHRTAFITAVSQTQQ